MTSPSRENTKPPKGRDFRLLRVFVLS
jgi:hypothetical protein